jgi:hypothetical protein
VEELPWQIWQMNNWQFVEQYPADAKVGAAMPNFESIHGAQEAAGDGIWGPFEDEKWQLAEWLIENVGQKQTDGARLKRLIVWREPYP